MWGAVTALSLAVAPLEGPLASPRPLARVVERMRGAGEPLVEYRAFNAGLPFYLKTHAYLIDVPRDLRFEGE